MSEEPPKRLGAMAQLREWARRERSGGRIDDAEISELDNGSVQAAWRMLLRLQRIFAWSIACLATVVIVLTSGVVYLAVNEEKEIVFVRSAGKNDQVLWFEPKHVRGEQRDLVTDQLLCGYVVDRETIDHQTERDRWERMRWLTEEEMFQRFIDTMTIKNPSSPYKPYYDDKRTRSAECKRRSMLSPTIWQVEYETEDRKEGQSKADNTRFWVATITVTFKTMAVRYQDRFMNPWGLQVVKYSVAERKL